MQFIKYIFELVVVYYVLKFVLSLIGSFFVVKQVSNKMKDAHNFKANPHNEPGKTTFTQPKKNMDIKDGDYIEYEEVKNDQSI